MDLGKWVLQHFSDGEMETATRSHKFGTLPFTASRWPLTLSLSPLRGARVPRGPVQEISCPRRDSAIRSPRPGASRGEGQGEGRSKHVESGGSEDPPLQGGGVDPGKWVFHPALLGPRCWRHAKAGNPVLMSLERTAGQRKTSPSLATMNRFPGDAHAVRPHLRERPEQYFAIVSVCSLPLGPRSRWELVVDVGLSRLGRIWQSPGGHKKILYTDFERRSVLRDRAAKLGLCRGSGNCSLRRQSELNRYPRSACRERLVV
jgi:hypothetical protein